MEELDSRKWLDENEDKWTIVGDEIIFNIPLEQVPQEVLVTAKAFKERNERAKKQMQILNSMGVNGMNENWD